MTKRLRKFSKSLGFGQPQSKRRNQQHITRLVTAKEKMGLERMLKFHDEKCFICTNRHGIKRSSGKFVCERCNTLWYHDEV